MFKNGQVSKGMAVVLMTAFVVGAAGSALAESNWAQDHPRRDQVNKRLKNQDRRINQEAKEGEITKQQAAKLHKEDRQIRKEERLMSRQNGGHITKQEQRTLNQQENQVSRQIGK